MLHAGEAFSLSFDLLTGDDSTNRCIAGAWLLLPGLLMGFAVSRFPDETMQIKEFSGKSVWQGVCSACMRHDDY